MKTLVKTYQFIDLDYLMSNWSNNTSMIEKLMQMFIETTPAQVQSLKNYVSEEHWEQVRETSHNLISSFSIFGTNDLSNLLANMEAITSKSEVSEKNDLKRLMNSVEEMSQSVFEEVNDALSK